MYNFENFYRANVKGIVVDAGHGGIGKTQNLEQTIDASKYNDLRYFVKRVSFFSSIISIN